MCLKEDVFDVPTVPYWNGKEPKTEADEAAKQEKLQYNAVKLVAAVITQTFHNMIEFGLTYSYITNGEAIVSLYTDWKNPKTVHYHLTIPSEDVGSGQNQDLAKTTISLNIVMCLMALTKPQYKPNQRNEVMSKLKKHCIDYHDILSRIPESERKQTPSKACDSSKPKFAKSYNTRSKKTLQRQDGSDSDDDAAVGGSGNNQGASNGVKINGSTNQNKPPTEQTSRNGKGSSNTDQEKIGSPVSEAYYTQACLSGLMRGGKVDSNCPNIGQHKVTNGYHTIVGKDVANMLQEQLAENLDDAFQPLWSQRDWLRGAKGFLFKITLLSHGYVMVAKTSTGKYIPDLKHEHRMYQHLESLQGKYIPVCLGTARLANQYPLDFGIYIRYMLFLSWGGECLSEDKPTYHPDVAESLSAVRNAAIKHGNIEYRNLLWNEELK